jgi:4-oxalocrotonate tautomerase
MPHVTVKCFPRELTSEQKQELGEAISQLLIKHLSCSESATSVSLQMVAQQDWQQQVWQPEIQGQPENLIKAPGYKL